ncbi:MAG: hypothetical protein ABI363_08610 [Nitrosospira sp.]
MNDIFHCMQQHRVPMSLIVNIHGIHQDNVPGSQSLVISVVWESDTRDASC